MFFQRILLAFNKFEDELPGGYSGLRRALKEFGRACYHSLSLIAVYCSGIAILITATCLILNARDRIKLGESKKSVVRVMIVSILIFSVAGIVQLVKDLAIKGI